MLIIKAIKDGTIRHIKTYGIGPAMYLDLTQNGWTVQKIYREGV